jgi:hypothetical protein
MIALMMEGVITSETSVSFYRLLAAIAQKAVIIILAAVRS